ncbi:hypothetical protein [Flavimarina sp. Hel_I_48]|uniref:hypothetical protein n=1 Tax=Flavimarina sp. Hel_I_48 TaxID=1392488 RepID=UPI0004DF5487|nr:hypothetical protein [Flavimarina sp. Hel_I_48]
MSSLFKYCNLLLCCILLYGCQEEVKMVKDPTKETDSLKIKIADSLRMDVGLNGSIEKRVQQIPGFSTLETALQGLQGESIGSVKIEAEEWINATKELRLALLDSVSNRAINARMTLLVTKASLLKQEVSKRIVDTVLISKEATEFYGAYQNLVTQLNLEYGTSVDDFLKDFKAESKKIRDDARKQKALQNTN